jgi:hypothetical protein
MLTGRCAKNRTRIATLQSHNFNRDLQVSSLLFNSVAPNPLEIRKSLSDLKNISRLQSLQH